MPQTFILLLTCCLPAQADTQLESMHQNAKKCIEATVKGDYAALVELYHPSLVEKAGGRDRLIELIQKGMEEMKKQGIQITSAKTAAPKAIVKGDKALYGVIPTTVVLDSEDTTITLKSFLVGVSQDQGKTWVFIDGAPGPENVRLQFPDIPRDLKLPEKEKPDIAKKQKPGAEKSPS